ncbi:MAG: YbaN family protein, partial [Defluviitaleaceae bacterium]|nr:YbaN family protein [Defluviitaleaceae bacterium]
LPTTPFVLAAAGCFSVASQKLNAWLTKSRLFGPFIENYRTGRGISNARKIASIAFLWTGLIISAIITQSLLILIILAIVGIGVSTHLLLIKKTEISD